MNRLSGEVEQRLEWAPLGRPARTEGIEVGESPYMNDSELVVDRGELAQ